MKNKGLLVLLLTFMSVLMAHAQQLPYLCDFGIQGGAAGYFGDANRVSEETRADGILNARWTAGAQFRYKFTNRWAVQVKGQYQRLAFKQFGENNLVSPYNSNMVNVDAVAEFNFLRYGENTMDVRVKPYTPYLFMGVGFALYGGKYENVSPYFPIGMGFKWRFAPRWQLVAAWQHNMYFKDNLETVSERGAHYGAEYDNSYDLNGSNTLNNDIIWQCTVGIVFEFMKKKAVCRYCGWN